MGERIGSQIEMEQQSPSTFMEMLESRFQQGFDVCVGLDSDYERLPISILDRPSTKGDRILEFNTRIADATHDLVAAFKPNAAFYRGLGDEGERALEKTIRYIKDTYPEIPVVLDAKEGDIGNTNRGYVEEAFDRFGADAVTVHAYLGGESLEPFLNRKDKGIFVLARTSNDGAGEFQDLPVDTGRLTRKYKEEFGDLSELSKRTGKFIIPHYQIVAYKFITRWNQNKNVGIVAGATYPGELAQIRMLAGDDMSILIPGLGAQGGELKSTVKAGSNSQKSGALFNSSRGIIFASSGKDFAEAARAATLKLHNDIKTVREKA